MDKSKIPLLVGVAQTVCREKVPLDPLQMMAEVSCDACKDAACAAAPQIDTLYIVNCISQTLLTPTQDLSQLLHIAPTEVGYTGIGATAPQWFINRAAERIYHGKSSWVLICGAEAFYGPQAAGLTGRVAVETIDSDKKADQHLVGDLRTPLTPIEMSYGLGLPVVIYAFFENALRAHWGKSPPDHIQEIAEFCARMSEIAVHNPYAWSRKARSAAEIATVTPDNRRIVYPYTKLMCSNIAVNQAAALLMTNLAVAQSSGIPHERIVFLRGCGDAEDNFYFSERPELWSSPSVADAVNAALGQASLQLDDIEFLDFYSCFPVAPRIAREELKIDPRDPRDLTITGGMPYFGGPGNNYALHTVCTMVQKLRERPQSLGSCRH